MNSRKMYNALATVGGNFFNESKVIILNDGSPIFNKPVIRGPERSAELFGKSKGNQKFSMC